MRPAPAWLSALTREDAMKGCRPLTDEEVQRISQSFGGTFAKRNKA
jgi:hypothetical protein